MLEIINATPTDLGKIIQIAGSLDDMRRKIFENGTVCCIKNCFYAADIDAMRQGVFDYYAQIPQAKFNIQSVNFEDPKQLDRNHHVIVRGISSHQKTLHYFHVYGFGDIDMLPSHIKTPVYGVFTSMIGLYNQLTEQDVGLETIFRNTKKIRPQFIQYPVGGGMFATHIHEAQPQKLGFVLAISKRGHDFNEGGTGFEAVDGSVVDTSTVHDIGDLLIFRYDLKHWVTACDITQPLDDKLSSGRWTAAIPIY